MLARPTEWSEPGPPPPIYLAPGGRIVPAEGERFLARLRALPGGGYEAKPMRRLPRAPAQVLAIYARTRAGGRLRPIDRRQRAELTVADADRAGAREGELVLAEPVGRASRLGLARARVVERLAPIDGTRSLSLLAIHAHDLPTRFPGEADRAAKAARPAPLGERADLRAVPFVTIDGADARDFDDAVWAEPEHARAGGWHVVVAIADVAWYVRPGDALDRAAAERGNSVYFPDRVVPMLPAALSNDLCSLRPGRDRPCLAAHLWLDATGRLRRHRFERAMIRSAARLTYEAVQAARDGRPEHGGPAVPPGVIENLYGAHAALAAATARRGALALELPERNITLTPTGEVAAMAPRARLDSHRLIETFMIAANVAAAETLERAHMGCLYRVHEAPDPEGVAALAELVRGLGLRLGLASAIRPALFNRLLDRARVTADDGLVATLVLRSQSKAVYAPRNLGHFGLALARYCHFTSPIRRYADLLIHRALITAGKLGPGGLDARAGEDLEAMGERLSAAERRAVAAERDAFDRYAAAFLAARLGARFAARITGIARAGLFLTLEETGADGFVPASSLAADAYIYDERRQTLAGRTNGRTYRLGERLDARLVEADPVRASLVFHLEDGTAAAPARPGRGGRPRIVPARGSRGRLRGRHSKDSD